LSFVAPVHPDAAPDQMRPTAAKSLAPARRLRVATRQKPFSFRRVATKMLSVRDRAALLGLLDDPAPGVRQALLAHFLALGADGTQFLREVAHDPHRPLARHAAWYLAELKFGDPVTEFRSFIRSHHHALETGALLLSRTVAPNLDLGACGATLDQIAARCRELISKPASAREQCRIINRVLFHEWGFHGNTEHYTDPLNSFLSQVLVRRKGIPISLSVLYLLVAGRLDLELEPVGLPGHFVVGCFNGVAPFFVDPFDRGVFRDTAEILDLLRANNLTPTAADLAPTPVREVLCRSCRNLVNHYSAAGDTGRARLFAGFVQEFESTHQHHAT
jgi:regulator of sirC expression with transglutaminase-like and TPR domain